LTGVAGRVGGIQAGAHPVGRFQADFGLDLAGAWIILLFVDWDMLG